MKPPHPPNDDPLSDAQIACLEALGRQTMRLIEVRRSNGELADVLERARLLDSLVPICAWCKRIRDDENYWSSIAEYPREHAGVDTSHGLCPECFEGMDGAES